MDARKLVKQAERDPWNRLNSIVEDADWVASFQKNHAPHLPILPNLRCGAWYVPQSLGKGCYFKSTDGHTSQWDFSLKRYNLDLIYTIKERKGCVIVDSTRRGKSMSDALSKTIPIWCAVLNAASSKKYSIPGSSEIKTGDVVSLSEQEQIKERLHGWVETLLSSDLTVPQLDKPLVPLFVTRKRKELAVCSIGGQHELDYYPVVLLSASQMVPTPGLDPLQSPVQKSSLSIAGEVDLLRRQARYIYVQGSGDDEEMWSLHMTPEIFWQPENLRKILEVGAGGPALNTLLEDIVSGSKRSSLDAKLEDDVKLADFGIYFGKRDSHHTFTLVERKEYALIVQADAAKVVEGQDTKASDTSEVTPGMILRFNIDDGKRGLKSFRQALPSVIAAARSVLPVSILLCSQDDRLGGDLVGGFAITVLSCCFDDAQQMVKELPLLSKDSIRRRLQWITSSLPSFVPPSRNHLLRINDFLLSDDYKSDGTDDIIHKMASLTSE